jgi:glutamate dehydrogenase/leucine dehydrogenase
MGMRAADLRHVLEAAGVPPRYRDLRVTRSGAYTALSVLAGVRAAADHLGIVLDRATAAIEGFGAVGSALAPLLASVGVRVSAISTLRGALFNPTGLDVDRIVALAASGGSSSVVERYPDAKRLDRTALLELPIDFLCPCARHGSVHSGNAARIRAQVIASGANNPVTPEAERALSARGVLCLPDFVTNCGGVLGSTMAFAAVSDDDIGAFIARRVGAQIRSLLREADRCGVTPREVALPLALTRFSELSRQGGATAVRTRTLALGVELFRRGWVPQRLVGTLAPAYFERTLARPFMFPG